MSLFCKPEQPLIIDNENIQDAKYTIKKMYCLLIKCSYFYFAKMLIYRNKNYYLLQVEIVIHGLLQAP